ncbi:MAG: hypothetical protein ABSG31_15270 [Tepidisphaeraceae bacterium]|jgi:hypothetical protein
MAEELNFEDELNVLLEREPFLSFEIVVSSGDRFRIADDTLVALGTNIVAIYPRESGTIILRKNQLVALVAL